MKLQYLFVVFSVLGLISCQKIKDLAQKGSQTSSETTADPELMKLVDQTSDGVVFRKDIPYPNRISVTVNRKSVISGRYSEKSELGNQVNSIRGTSTTIMKLDRKDNTVTYSLVKSNFEKPLSNEELKQGKTPEISETYPPNKEPYVFVKTGNVWKPANATDFRIAALSQEICPVFDQLLADHGLAAPTQWFGKHRIKIGDSLTVSDKNLKMFFASPATGSLKLTLESISAVQGHPCGVFALSGSYSRKRFPDFHGNFADEDVTIQSGKIWLSLLYPLVMKMEADTVSTRRGGSQGGLVTGTQGSVIASMDLDWKNAGP